jgi:hypothetical protein|nr:MAG TPA: protein of unknown function (DUF4250) [Caudoviricetes sp.]
MKIADVMNESAQVQEFVEKMLSVAYDTLEEDEYLLEEVCDDIGVTESELKWMFKQLGYDR